MRVSGTLHYIVMPTRVGQVLVVMSGSGVVDVVLGTSGTSAGDPTRRLGSRFPGTRLVEGDAKHRRWAAAVVARIDGAHTETDAPVDLAWSAQHMSTGHASRPAENPS